MTSSSDGLSIGTSLGWSCEPLTFTSETRPVFGCKVSSRGAVALRVRRARTAHPVQSQPCQDVHGNLLVVLGFLATDHGLPSHEHLLAGCVRDSVQVLEACEGEFVAMFVEGPSGKVHIVNDRFASRPFYGSPGIPVVTGQCSLSHRAELLEILI